MPFFKFPNTIAYSILRNVQYTKLYTVLYNKLHSVQATLVTLMKVPNRRRPPELFKMIECSLVKQRYF